MSRQLQFEARHGIVVPLFTLFPVDDIPNLFEVLIIGGASQSDVSPAHTFTHRSPGIKVLQIVCMLPDIDADDRYMSKKRVLIRCGDDLKDLCLGVPRLGWGENRPGRRDDHIQASPSQSLE